MPHKVFLDTNIVLDQYLDREVHRKYVDKIFEQFNLSQLTISAISVLNSYYIAKPKDIKLFQKAIMSFNIVEVDADILRAAFTIGLKDCEDAVQLISCLRAGCDTFLTWNAKDFPKSYKSIKIAAPDTFLTNS